MHPDVNLSPEEAQTLFALAQNAISAILMDIGKIEAASVSAAADLDGESEGDS